MKKRVFCCDGSRHLYETYYMDQTGNGMPVFYGSRGQRGHGLGSILGGLFRGAMPMIKRGLAAFGKQALRTGLEMANDVADGYSVKSSAKQRIPQAIKRLAGGVLNQSGSGHVKVKRRKTSKKVTKKTSQPTKKRRRRRRDIFG